MDHGRVILADIERALTERHQAATVAKMALYGGQSAWFDVCRRRRQADSDFQLARVIIRLLRAGGDAGPLRCHRVDLKRLEADPAVAAYWRSVAAAGSEGWREERQRLKAVATEAAASADPVERQLALDTNAILNLVPTYRAWGAMLLQAG